MLVIFALVQFNDPDPLLWVLVYLTGAYICFANIYGRTAIRNIFIAAYAMFLLYLLWTNWPVSFDGFSQDADAPNLNVEKARESGGVIIGLIMVAISTYLSRSA